MRMILSSHVPMRPFSAAVKDGSVGAKMGGHGEIAA